MLFAARNHTSKGILFYLDYSPCFDIKKERSIAHLPLQNEEDSCYRYTGWLLRGECQASTLMFKNEGKYVFSNVGSSVVFMADIHNINQSAISGQ